MEFWGDVVRVLEVPCFRYLLGLETLNAILVVGHTPMDNHCMVIVSLTVLCVQMMIVKMMNNN